MKMTLHIDAPLLARVMKATGASSKTRAVDIALREMDRRTRLAELASAGLGLSPLELEAAVNPDYDLEALRAAEKPLPYGRKPGTR